MNQPSGSRLEFYFDLSSPPSYIAYMRLPKLLAGAGVDVAWRPVLVGGIFKMTGNAAPVAVPAKRRYMMDVELPRQAERHGIPLDFHRGAPFESLGLMRGALAADEASRFDDYVSAMFRAQWAEARDLANSGDVAEVLARSGLDARLLDRAQDKEIKQRLIAVTEAAVARGIFGVPTFFVGDEQFFGQDHLDLAVAVARGLSSTG